MRCGFDRLADLVKSELGLSPLNGSLFVFFGRGRRRVKILFWERDGYWLFYNQLSSYYTSFDCMRVSCDFSVVV